MLLCDWLEVHLHNAALCKGCYCINDLHRIYCAVLDLQIWFSASLICVSICLSAEKKQIISEPCGVL